MENTTRLLQRQAALLAGRRALIIDANDGALRDLPAAHLHLHGDLANLPLDQTAPVPEIPADTDLLIVILPKARERLDMLLATLAGNLSAPMECWLVGPGKGGIRGALKQFARHAGAEPEAVDSARHCKLYRGQLVPADPAPQSDFVRRWSLGGLTLCSLPGVFSHGRLDDGTDLLLEELKEKPPAGPVLDIGCGAGVLTASLAAQGLSVTAVDVSATAVAATRLTLAENGLHAEVHHSDLYQAVPGRFRTLCTNPPFHDGLTHTTDISRRLISEAPRHLLPGGQLLLVANQGLPYGDWLREHFTQVAVARENRRFKVWRASLRA
ncbi:class I SAM-dependent methyltransferase [Alcanivorax sp. JB21]|uniref:class I SAM-dependent methyltransferase n=1 Tax=Alcanivorax limicola TaxID=2874102 RepID=UPI001CBD8949|nr:class I SAM-dependent methyltransferase [Alcanivorax limicola]MBZ2188316.1 class I SAM-dependent methyltransferase [Alcanivorax limicola]